MLFKGQKTAYQSEPVQEQSEIMADFEQTEQEPSKGKSKSCPDLLKRQKN